MRELSRFRIGHRRRLAPALATVALALVIPASTIGADDGRHKTDAEIRAAVDSCIGTSMRLDGTPGVGLAVVKDHDVFYERGYGVRDLNAGSRVDAHTRLRIASVRKMFTAAAVLQLVDQGLVQLHDFVTEYIPELRFAGRWPTERMTVRDLLVHTSGVFDTAPTSGVSSHENLVEWLAGTRLSSPPGTLFNYAGPNYSPAGLVVERAGGLEFADYLQRRIFGPASMEASTLRPEEVVASGNHATGYQLRSGLAVHPQDFHDRAFAPAGRRSHPAGR